MLVEIQVKRARNYPILRNMLLQPPRRQQKMEEVVIKWKEYFKGTSKENIQFSECFRREIPLKVQPILGFLTITF